MSVNPTERNAGPSGDSSMAKKRTGGIWGFFHYGHHGRSLPMDMLRGVAILLVLGQHHVFAPDSAGALRPLAAFGKTIGWAGVDLFFVLSGFLVSGLIFSEFRQKQRVDIRRFVIRRGFKIWPPYLVYIGVVALWLTWQYRQGRVTGVWSEMWPNVFHVQNYFHTPRLHTWSLAVEEHFYLVAAFVFFVVLGRRNGREWLRYLPAFVVLCVGALAAFRHLAFLRHGPEHMNLYATHLRFDGLLIGTLVAYWTHFDPPKLAWIVQRPVRAMLVGAVLAAPTLALAPEASAWSAGVGLTAVYIGFALLMLGWLNVTTVHRSCQRAFATWPAAALGSIGFFSYSIYLWHVDLAQTPMKKVVQLADGSAIPPAVLWTAVTIAYVVLSVVVGTIMAKCLEIPSLALRDRLFPAAAKPMTSASLTGRATPTEVAVVACIDPSVPPGTGAPVTPPASATHPVGV